jgi:hypothetical protein
MLSKSVVAETTMTRTKASAFFVLARHVGFSSAGINFWRRDVSVDGVDAGLKRLSRALEFLSHLRLRFLGRAELAQVLKQRRLIADLVLVHLRLDLAAEFFDLVVDEIAVVDLAILSLVSDGTRSCGERFVVRIIIVIAIISTRLKRHDFFFRIVKTY